MVFLDLKDQEVTGVQLVLLEILVNLVLLVQEELRERQGILGPLENKEKLESQEEEDQGYDLTLFGLFRFCKHTYSRDPLVNLATLAARACLVWRAGLDHPVPLDLLDPLGTPSQWPLLPCKERLCQESLGHLDQWDHSDLPVKEGQMVQEDRREAEESLVWLDPLALLEDRVFLADPETLVSQASLADLEDLILRMTSERSVPLCSEV